MPIFKIAIFGHETWPRSCTYTPFLLQGVEFELIFCSTGSDFRDTGRFLKLPYLGMRLGHQPKFQKLHIYSLSTPWGWNWADFRSTGSGFRGTGRFSKLPYLGMKLGNGHKVPEVANIISFCPMGSKLSLFSLYDIGKFSFPIGHNVKFQSCFKLNLKFQNSYK